MARILLGWELGGHRGHALNLARQRDALAAAGHEVTIAAQIPAALSPCADVVQAPVWPRMLATEARAAPPPETLGDILIALGLGEPGMLGSLIQSWEFIFRVTRAQIVVADYAPAMLAAARGRVPAIVLGRGFDLPPAELPCFPSLTGRVATYDEAAALARVNAELRDTGRSELAALPALFAADRALVGAIAEIDPHAAHRRTPLADATLAPPPPLRGDGAEIFVYWPARAPPASALWTGLKRTALRVRLHIPSLSDADAATLGAAGFTVERAPLPFALIAKRSRMVVSHGGHGFTAAALLAGLPQVIVSTDLEKAVHARAVQALAVGEYAPLARVEAAHVAAGVKRVYESEQVRETARVLAETMRARLSGTLLGPEATLAAVESLGV